MIIVRVPEEAPRVMQFVHEYRRHRLTEHGRTDDIEIHLTIAQARAAALEAGLPDEDDVLRQGGTMFGLPWKVHDEPQPQCRICYTVSLSPVERERFMAEPVVTTVHRCPKHQAWWDDLTKRLEPMLIDRREIHGQWITQEPEPLTPERMTALLDRSKVYFAVDEGETLDSAASAQERSAEGGA